MLTKVILKIIFKLTKVPFYDYSVIKKNSEKVFKIGRIRKVRKRSEKFIKFESFPPNSEDLATLIILPEITILFSALSEV